MQQFSFIDLFIDPFESVLHVSGGKLAHLQERFMTVYTAFGTTHRYYCRPVTLAPVGSNIGALYQKLYIGYSQKNAPKVGEFVARNM